MFPMSIGFPTVTNRHLAPLTFEEKNALESDTRLRIGNYDNDNTFTENVINSVLRGDFPTEGEIVLNELTFNLASGSEITLPPNVRLQNCYVSRGTVIFYQGNLTANGQGAIADAHGNGAVANAYLGRAKATAEGSIANSYGDGVYAIATVAGAIANANWDVAIAYATAGGAVANANTDGALAAAKAPGAIAYANTSGSYAEACSDWSVAYANAEGAVANANTAFAVANAMAAGSEANANNAGAVAKAFVGDSVANARDSMAIALAMGYGAVANANYPNSFAQAIVGGSIANANVSGAYAEATIACAEANANVSGALAVATVVEATANATVVGALAQNMDIAEYILNEERVLQILWDNHAEESVQLALNSNQVKYNEKGGIKDIFNSQKPNDFQIEQIHSYIKLNPNFEKLKSNEGLKVANGFINLTEGRDCISFEVFDSAIQTEWCLLRQGGDKYNLITATTAEQLILLGNKNPFDQCSLTANDILRGQAVIDIFKNQ